MLTPQRQPEKKDLKEMSFAELENEVEKFRRIAPKFKQEKPTLGELIDHKIRNLDNAIESQNKDELITLLEKYYTFRELNFGTVFQQDVDVEERPSPPLVEEKNTATGFASEAEVSTPQDLDVNKRQTEKKEPTSSIVERERSALPRSVVTSHAKQQKYNFSRLSVDALKKEIQERYQSSAYLENEGSAEQKEQIKKLRLSLLGSLGLIGPDPTKDQLISALRAFDADMEPFLSRPVYVVLKPLIAIASKDKLNRLGLMQLHTNITARVAELEKLLEKQPNQPWNQLIRDEMEILKSYTKGKKSLDQGRVVLAICNFERKIQIISEMPSFHHKREFLPKEHLTLFEQIGKQIIEIQMQVDKQKPGTKTYKDDQLAVLKATQAYLLDEPGSKSTLQAALANKRYDKKSVFKPRSTVKKLVLQADALKGDSLFPKKESSLQAVARRIGIVR